MIAEGTFFGTQMRFELEHLSSYDETALIAELRRVAALVDRKWMSRAQFDKFAKVHSSTIGKKFGTWEAALTAAGLSDRFDDSAAAYNKEELLAAIRSVAQGVKTGSITLSQFKAHSGIDGGPVRRVFGSWAQALEAAGLSQSALARRYTDEQCYENLLSLWVHYGRPPHHDEANTQPSLVGSKAYIRRWGTWRKALEAFVTRANASVTDSVEPRPEAIHRT